MLIKYHRRKESAADMICNKKIIVLCTSRIYDPQTHLFIEKLNESLRDKDIRLLI